MTSITPTAAPAALACSDTASIVGTLHAIPLAEATQIGSTVLQIEHMNAARLASVSLSAIDELMVLLDDIASHVKSAQGEVSKALAARFAEQAKAQLLASGHDTGTTHIFADDYDITVEIDKTVKWDQKQLATIFERIGASGDKPGQYIEVKYAVAEAKFKGWPDTLRKPFEAARTVAPGKPKFTLRRAGEVQ